MHELHNLLYMYQYTRIAQALLIAIKADPDSAGSGSGAATWSLLIAVRPDQEQDNRNLPTMILLRDCNSADVCAKLNMDYVARCSSDH